ncbi:MAG: hypothetical protein M0R80_23245 [Proteobacteria bacterium]|jgi:hypothetical protein|nr:hypothetical protein [Pseudomonadota bacterium]
MGKCVRTAALLAGFLLLLAACTARPAIDVEGDGSGTAKVRLEVKKLFADYFTADDGAKVFDVARIEKGIEKRPGFVVRRISTPTPETLEMDLVFHDIRSLFSDEIPPSNNGIIHVTKKDGKTTIALHLDRDSAKQVGTLFSAVSNPAFKEMSPREQRTRTEKEYLEAIEFAVGKEGPPLMKGSYLELTVRPNGEIVSQVGGKIMNGTAVFNVPLMRMIMLEKPLDYSVTFTPAPKKGAKKPKV